VRYSLGVDLGTTFVAAAVTHGGSVEMFPLGDGAMVMPAAVYLRNDGMLITGDAAARRAVSNPDRVAVEIKRRLGNPTPVMLGGSPHAVTSLLAALLENALDRVTEIQGGKPAVVALTHPANWGPYRRELFEEVPQAVGLEDPLHVTEPEAAAAHYLSTNRLAEGEIIAVYDLGGGTFDATVLRRAGAGFEILGAPEGIERLGGADFDEAILAHVNYVGGDALGDLDMSDPRTVVALARLRQDCVLAKEALSVDVETTIPVFLPGRQFEVSLTRGDFEDMIRAPVESTIGTLDRVLRAAQVQPGELAAVLLVGGSSRIPLVGRMVAEEFGRPTVVGAHPKHAVALGAALLADRRQQSSGSAERRPAPAADAAPAPASGALPAGSVPAAAGPAAPTPGAPTPEGPAGPPDPGDRVPAAATAQMVLPTLPPAGAPGARVPAGVAAPAAATPGQAIPEPRPSAGPADTGGAPGAPGAGGPPAGSGGSGSPAGPSASAPRGGRRRLLVVLGTVLAVLALGAGLAAYLLTRPTSPSATTTAGRPSASPSAPSPGPTVAAPVAAAVASSVPVPSIAGSIDVGPTPNFVAVSPSGRQLYIAGRDSGVVSVVDTTADKVVATIKIPTGPPQFLAFSPDGRQAYVSVWNDARTIAAVSVLDTTTNSVVATIPVHTRPFLGAVTPDGKHLYVPNHDSGTVSVISTQTHTLETEFSVPPNPHSVAFSADGTRAYIADHESNLVSVVDTSTHAVVAKVPVQSSPHNLAVSPRQPLVGVADFDAADLSLIDTGTNRVVATVPVGKNPQHVAWAPDGRFVYVVDNADNTLDVVSADTHQVTASIPTGASPTSIAVLPDGRRGFVSNLDSGTLTVLDLAG